MSVDITTVPYHKLIKAPVNPAEVCGVLGTKINIWAKYKPVRYGQIDTVTIQWDATNQRWKSQQELPIGTIPWWEADGSCGLSITGCVNDNTTNNIKTMCQNWKTNGWRYFWNHLAPRGGSVTPNEPYRLTDFAGYVHFDSTMISLGRNGILVAISSICLTGITTQLHK